MSIDVSVADDAEEWNRLVERSGQSTPFHRYEALEAMTEHSGADCYPFVGRKGQEPVGLFPVFQLQKGPITLAVSPPPDLEVSYLGPARFQHNGMKQRKEERRHRRFVDAIFEAVDDHVAPNFTHIRAGTEYPDPRPFIWREFETTPRHTYHVDITPDTEELFMSFSSDIRKNVRKARDEHDYEITEGGADDIGEIIRHVEERHAEQDVAYTVPPAFGEDLATELPEGAVRAYTCRSDGAFLGGLVTLEDDDTLYRWQSVADLDHDIAVSDVLDWELIQRARDRGIERLDLVGANNERLCGYKAKFNPNVRTYYSLERGSTLMDIAKSVYLRLQ
jgi:CelD/BcsL family acetyltransferase involved in cellulose biosynthesis